MNAVSDLTIKTMSQDELDWLDGFIEKEWGGNSLVIRAKSYYPKDLPG